MPHLRSASLSRKVRRTPGEGVERRSNNPSERRCESTGDRLSGTIRGDNRKPPLVDDGADGELAAFARQLSQNHVETHGTHEGSTFNVGQLLKGFKVWETQQMTSTPDNSKATTSTTAAEVSGSHASQDLETCMSSFDFHAADSGEAQLLRSMPSTRPGRLVAFRTYFRELTEGLVSSLESAFDFDPMQVNSAGGAAVRKPQQPSCMGCATDTPVSVAKARTQSNIIQHDPKTTRASDVMKSTAATSVPTADKPRRVTETDVVERVRSSKGAAISRGRQE